MKSKIVTKVMEPVRYPRLKRSSLTGIVALFTSSADGIFVYVPPEHDYNNPIGKNISVDTKSFTYWKDFTGTIELSN